MDYKLAIFDLDGTILNTIDDLAISVNYALKKSGLPVRTLDEVRSFVGNGIQKLIDRAVPKNTSPEKIKNVYDAFVGYYKEHCKDNTKPYDKITDVLRTLKKSGIKIAVVSNKADFAVRELCLEYFNDLYDIAVGERAGIRRKPAPDTVFEVLKHLDISPEQSVFIGDSDVDIDTAKNSNMDCISVNWGFKDTDFLINYGASKIVSSPDELLEHFEINDKQ